MVNNSRLASTRAVALSGVWGMLTSSFLPGGLVGEWTSRCAG
ncbi:hypothetical protein SAMN05661080_04990, partial [Modestobacter sp. DSM 44400]